MEPEVEEEEDEATVPLRKMLLRAVYTESTDLAMVSN